MSDYPTWEELPPAARDFWRTLLAADLQTRGPLAYQSGLPARPATAKQLYGYHRAAMMFNGTPIPDGMPLWSYDTWAWMQPSFQTAPGLPYGWDSLQYLSSIGMDYPDLRTAGTPVRVRREGPPQRRRNLPTYTPPPWPRI